MCLRIFSIESFLNAGLVTTSYTISGENLNRELQNVLDDPGRDYFQLKLGLDGITNNDDVHDGVKTDLREVFLDITYSD